jgi:hypothetical protein
MKRCLVIGWVLWIACGVLNLAVRAADAAPEYTAARISTPPRIDGRIEPGEWEAAAPPIRLTQQEPDAGAPPTEETEIRVLRDGESIYIAVRCFDKEPRKIAVSTKARDGDIDDDDYVSLLLDTFLDRRSGYVFEINPAGAKRDGLAKAGDVDYSWDGIWDGRASRDPEGWSAEFRIPTKTIAFKPDQSDWGFNAQRVVRRKRENDRWSGATLNAHFMNAAEAGLLHGMQGLKQGRGWSIRPYGAFKSGSNPAAGLSRDNTGDFGFDVYKSLTSNLNAVFTYNTDFAETEADTRQINLTRFPLFYPEKRSFFLEGSNIFDFGIGLGHNFIPFFSRRVGLVSGEQVPILMGGKLWGRIGGTSVGVLDVQTDSYESPDLSLGGQNLLAARVEQDLWDQSHIGLMVTNGDPTGYGSNTLVGADFVYQTNSLWGDKNFAAGGWAAYSHNESGGDRPYGWGLALDYPNDFLDTTFIFQSFGDALDPALGFLPRPGTHHLSYQGQLGPRPHKWGIRKFMWAWSADLWWQQDGRLESRTLSANPLGILWDTGEFLMITYSSEYEYLAEPFEISDGLTIAPGSYLYDRVQARFETANFRKWRFEVSSSLGTFYDGRLESYAGEFVLKPNATFQTAFSTEYVTGRLSGGKFIQRLMGLQLDYYFSPEMTLTTFTQYDNESENLGTNIRFRWTLKPGTDLFLVYNQGWNHIPDESLRLPPAYDQFAIKFVYTLRP